MRVNRSNVRTEEGADAAVIDDWQQLRRSVLSCLLWEKEHYEDGISIAQRIAETARLVDEDKVAFLAKEARTLHGIRHAPLLLLIELVRRKASNVRTAIAETISRPDEIGELLSLYWRDGKRPIPHQMRLGMIDALGKFDEYSLAKNDGGAIRLRDILRLVRPVPKSPEQEALFGKIVRKEMATPDTWEVALSAGADKKETFTRLISEGRLGYLALLRNLRNMETAGVDKALVNDAIVARKGAKFVFPFRYVAAARAAPSFEEALDKAFVAAASEIEKLPGQTVVIVDVSGSMYGSPVSAKSDMKRVDAAAALAAIAREMCEDVVLVATANSSEKVPARHGMALVDAIVDMPKKVGHGGIYTHRVMEYAKKHWPKARRVIVVTDEQDCGGHGESPLTAPVYAEHNYMINVASYRNGVGYGKWVHLDGFSEAIMKFIIEYEKFGKTALDRRRLVG